MFTGFTDETIQFFLDLHFHNDHEYFHANHDRYVRMVQQPFYEMIDALAPDMLKIDASMEIRPYKCLSRIHRDTRFSRDKSPYRDHLWYLFRRAGETRDKSLFYFFEMGPSRLNWGMGFWNENREALDLFRKHLRANPSGSLALIDSLHLPGRKLALDGTIHKKMSVPAEIPEELRRWYLSKDFYICKLNPDFRMVFSDRIVREVRSDFQALAPLYRLLRGFTEELEKESEE